MGPNQLSQIVEHAPQGVAMKCLVGTYDLGDQAYIYNFYSLMYNKWGLFSIYTFHKSYGHAYIQIQ